MRPVYAVIVALMVTTLTAAAMWQSYRLGRAGEARDAAEQQLSRVTPRGQHREGPHPQAPQRAP